MKRFNVAHKYFTATLGINPSYRSHSYYDKIINKDSVRVYRKFQTAQRDGLHIEKQTCISNEYLMWHLAKHGPIILLTNAALLSCTVCKQNKLSTEIRFVLQILKLKILQMKWLNRTCFPVTWKPSYSGHYIVLCGYNRNAGHFLYRNPVKHDRKYNENTKLMHNGESLWWLGMYVVRYMQYIGWIKMKVRFLIIR